MALPTKPDNLPTDMENPVRGEPRATFASKANTFLQRLVDEFTPDLNALAEWFNQMGVEIETIGDDVEQNATNATNAQTAAEGFRDETQVLRDETATIASSIPDGTINDAITTLTDTWSSSKISSEIASAGAVDSVNGQTGTVVLDKADVGLGNVDNTSDANKLINASNLNTGTVPSARLPNATATEVGALKVRLNGTEAFFTNDGNDA